MRPNNDAVTVRVGQGDAVLASPEHLPNVAERDLGPRILVDHQVHRPDAGSIQILGARQNALVKQSREGPGTSPSKSQNADLSFDSPLRRGRSGG